MVDLGRLLPLLGAAFSFRASRGGSHRASRAIGPAVAGTWYPASADALASEVEELLGRAPAPAADERAGRVIALIGPHAGYAYSGETAARGFRLLRGASFRRVLLLGPSHYAWFRGAAIPDAETVRTPLGEVPIDRAALESLAGKPGFSSVEGAFDREHCLEAEIPFLQRVLEPGWGAVPVLLGSGTSGELAQKVADGLASLFDDGTLVVVSSDFTHFGAGFGYVPFHDSVPERIRELDMGAARLIETRDVDGFEGYVGRTGATICGRDAIDVLLRMLPVEATASLVAYDTSGRMTGDWSHTVSYATIVFRRPDHLDADPPTKEASSLSSAERSTLLTLAEAAIREAILEDGSLRRALALADLTPALREIRGAFVTIKEPAGGGASDDLRLRGCIGTIFPHEPLFESVAHNAVQSALHDPRFRPVGAGELDGIAISISALTPSRRVSGPEEIVPGRHGVVLEKGLFKAVFLPQVATEQGWGRRELLEHLAAKAGLPRDGWIDATFSVFEAEVFGRD